jgi:hypothetical protein
MEELVRDRGSFLQGRGAPTLAADAPIDTFSEVLA